MMHLGAFLALCPCPSRSQLGLVARHSQARSPPWVTGVPAATSKCSSVQLFNESLSGGLEIWIGGKRVSRSTDFAERADDQDGRRDPVLPRQQHFSDNGPAAMIFASRRPGQSNQGQPRYG
jgi:hypothetical protein